MPRITLRSPVLYEAIRDASMRPGRNAPDNPVLLGYQARWIAASMRPGRNAPDNQEDQTFSGSCRHGFNEAGAKCPG